MSIHLDCFRAKLVKEGIRFGADVNGRRVRCIVTLEAIAKLAGNDRSTDPKKLFKIQWPSIRDKAYEKIRARAFDPTETLVLTAEDFRRQSKANQRATVATHACPHCGAVYEMSESQRGKSTHRTAVCSYCGDVMAAWRGRARRYRKIEVPSASVRIAHLLDEIPRVDSRKR
jgi:Protein of unknown function (DUF1488)